MQILTRRESRQARPIRNQFSAMQLMGVVQGFCRNTASGRVTADRVTYKFDLLCVKGFGSRRPHKGDNVRVLFTRLGSHVTVDAVWFVSRPGEPNMADRFLRASMGPITKTNGTITSYDEDVQEGLIKIGNRQYNFGVHAYKGTEPPRPNQVVSVNLTTDEEILTIWPVYQTLKTKHQPFQKRA